MNKSLFNKSVSELSEILHNLLKKESLTLSSAESCTGGMISACMTDRAGSSEVFWGGAVSYANEAKADLLKIPLKKIDLFGAVSKEIAEAMCRGISEISGTDLSVSVTGIAGPGGGSLQKPVGTVFIGVYDNRKNIVKTGKYQFKGSRNEVRKQTVCASLIQLIEIIGIE